MSAPSWDDALVETLTELADPASPNRAAMAHLRRGLGLPVAATLSRVGWLFNRVPDDRLDEAVLVAQLFARVKGDCPHTPGVTFGQAFGTVGQDGNPESREKRFIDLLDTDVDELPYKLRQAVTLIGRTGTGLDWVRLIKQLGHWDHPDRWVQKEWARGFWSAAADKAADAEHQTAE